MRIVIIAGAENYFTPVLSNADRIETQILQFINFKV